MYRTFRELRLHLQDVRCRFGSTKPDDSSSGLLLPNHQRTLKMGTEFPKPPNNLHFLTRLSALEKIH